MTKAELMERFIDSVVSIFASIPFSGATWFVLFTLMFFVVLFAKAHNSTHNPVYWEHLIIDSSNNRASPYKMGYLVGVIVSTWIVIQFADKNGLTFDILGVYLTYLVSGAGINTFTKAKQADDRRVLPRPDPEREGEEEKP